MSNKHEKQNRTLSLAKFWDRFAEWIIIIIVVEKTSKIRTNELNVISFVNGPDTNSEFFPRILAKISTSTSSSTSCTTAT